MSEKKRTRSISLRKILQFYMLAIVVVTGIALVYFLVFAIPNARDSEESSHKQLAAQAVRNIEDIFDSASKMAEIAAYSNVTQQYLLSLTPSEVISARNQFDALSSYLTTFSRNSQSMVFASRRGRYISSTYGDNEIFQESFDAIGLSWSSSFKKAVYSPLIYSGNRRYIVYICPVYAVLDGYRNRKAELAYGIVYDVDSLLDTATAGTDSIAILAGEDGMIAASKDLPDSVINENHDSYLEYQGIWYLATTTPLADTPMQLVYLTPFHISGYLVPFIPLTAILLLVIFITIAILILFYRVGQDITEITDAVRDVSEDDLPLPDTETLELQPIVTTMNETLENLYAYSRREQKLIAEHYRGELAQQQAELLAFRNQINPHFLFNTLESGRAMARHYKAEPLEQLIQGMARMFRYSLYSPMIVTLADELETLDTYMSVMHVRFPGKFTVKKHIPEETLSWPMLSMLLQPIVENTVQHAFIGRMHGIIQIRTWFENGRLVVELADNGVGLSEEDLAIVQRKIRDTSSDTASIREAFPTRTTPSAHDPASASVSSAAARGESIGLSNIYRRLKITFGDHAHIRIDSRENHYTVVRLFIPEKPDNPSLFSGDLIS